MALTCANRHSRLCQPCRAREVCSVNRVPLCIIICGALDISALLTLTSRPVWVDSKVHVPHWHVSVWGRICGRTLTVACRRLRRWRQDRRGLWGLTGKRRPRPLPLAPFAPLHTTEAMCLILCITLCVSLHAQSCLPHWVRSWGHRLFFQILLHGDSRNAVKQVLHGLHLRARVAKQLCCIQRP